MSTISVCILIGSVVLYSAIGGVVYRLQGDLDGYSDDESFRMVTSILWPVFYLLVAPVWMISRLVWGILAGPGWLINRALLKRAKKPKPTKTTLPKALIHKP